MYRWILQAIPSRMCIPDLLVFCFINIFEATLRYRYALDISAPSIMYPISAQKASSIRMHSCDAIDAYKIAIDNDDLFVASWHTSVFL